MTPDSDQPTVDESPIIRVAMPEDVVAISRMWLKFMDYNSKFDQSFKVKSKIVGRFARELQQRLDDPNYRLAVVDIDDELAGYCLSYISRKPYFFKLGKFGFVGDLFIREEYRRRGYGKLLVDDAHAFFRRKKVNQIELLVAQGNVNTIRFWEKLGYKALLQWMYLKQ